MEIRRGKVEDLDAISAVESACFPPSEGATKEDFQKRLSVYPEYFLLMLDEGRLVSFVDGFVTDERDLLDIMYEDASMHNVNGKWQMIFGVNTIPGCRRKGYAETLLKMFIRVAKDEGREGVVLTAKENMVHYYEKFGFINEGISASTHGDVRWYQMRLTF